MKIAISAKGGKLDDDVDTRFGRAKMFIIYDSESKNTTSASNLQNLNAAQGAGIQSAQNVINAGVQMVFTGHCGPNAFKTLSAADIKVVLNITGTVQDIISLYESGQYKVSESEDVEGHWV
ncbi:MAG: NifB/NifX family molybdenum-iron cluster-binding protein [bacterium]